MTGKFGGYGSGDQTERRITELERGVSVRAKGVLSLAVSPATTTTVTHPSIRSDSAVFWSPANSSSAISAITSYVASAGEITFTHSSSGSARTYLYIAVA